MKIRVLITSALAAALLVSGNVGATEKKLTKNQLPDAVVEAVDKAYPDANEAEFKEESVNGEAAYEVVSPKYKNNGYEYELLFDANGALVMKEEEVEFQTLPGPVIQAVKNKYSQARIKEVEMLIDPDGTVIGYEIEIQEAGKEFDLEVDPEGKILKTDQD